MHSLVKKPLTPLTPLIKSSDSEEALCVPGPTHLAHGLQPLLPHLNSEGLVGAHEVSGEGHLLLNTRLVRQGHLRQE